MTRKFRMNLLLWLDALGKWSLIDVYVLVLMMVAFSFDISSPDDLDWLPADFLDLHVYVVPGWGIYGFIIAAIISLIVTHVLLHYQRKEEEFHLHGGTERDRSSDRRAASYHSYFCYSGWDSATKVQVTWFTQIMLLIILMGSMVLLVYGSNIDSYEFAFSGAASLALDDKLLSLFSTAEEMLPPNPVFGEYMLYWVFLGFAFIIPLANLIVLLFLAYCPLQIHLQNKLLYSQRYCLHGVHW
eukprot:UN31005